MSVNVAFWFDIVFLFSFCAFQHGRAPRKCVPAIVLDCDTALAGSVCAPTQMQKPETPIWAFDIDDKDLVYQFVWVRGLFRSVTPTERGTTGYIRVCAAYRRGSSVAVPAELRGECRGHLCADVDCTARWKGTQYRPNAPPRPSVHMFACPVPGALMAGDESDAALAGTPADAAPAGDEAPLPAPASEEDPLPAAAAMTPSPPRRAPTAARRRAQTGRQGAEMRPTWRDSALA